jgi:hypothetical protein
MSINIVGEQSRRVVVVVFSQSFKRDTPLDEPASMKPGRAHDTSSVAATISGM